MAHLRRLLIVKKRSAFLFGESQGAHYPNSPPCFLFALGAASLRAAHQHPAPTVGSGIAERKSLPMTNGPETEWKRLS